jgi:bifunctional DNase/RNase
MVREMIISGLTMDPQTNTPIVVLKDPDSETSLPIWIGLLEATAIATELEKVEFSRPMTPDGPFGGQGRKGRGLRPAG